MNVRELEEYVSHIVCGLVDSPNSVLVKATELNARFIVELETASNDVGQVIGTKGFVVGAIRSLLSAYGGKNKCKVELDYVTERQKREAQKRRS